ncbi:MAG: hypothetical protein AB9844_02840 [Clostridiaceae bacterium]
MGMEFKKVMFGYNTDEVDNKISAIETEIARNIESAEAMLKSTLEENKALLEELDRLNEEKVKFDEFNQKVGNILREAFVSASEEVYNFKTQVDMNINTKIQKLDSLQVKNGEINDSIDRLLAKLDNIESN